MVRRIRDADLADIKDGAGSKYGVSLSSCPSYPESGLSRFDRH